MYGGALARPFLTHHHALNQDLYPRIALELFKEVNNRRVRQSV